MLSSVLHLSIKRKETSFVVVSLVRDQGLRTRFAPCISSPCQSHCTSFVFLVSHLSNPGFSPLLNIKKTTTFVVVSLVRDQGLRTRFAPCISSPCQSHCTSFVFLVSHLSNPGFSPLLSIKKCDDSHINTPAPQS